MAKPVKKIVFLGSKRLGLKCLQAIYASTPDRILAVVTYDDHADSRSELRGFQGFCQEKKIPIHVSGSPKEAENILENLQPDFCLVVGWYWLISHKILAAASSGFVGLHNSLLPKYRGGSPLVWAMVRGEKKVGLSFFSISGGMDEGNVWGQVSTVVGESDAIDDVLLRLEAKAVQFLRKSWRAMVDKKIRAKPQRHSAATFCAQRQPEDGLIPWHLPARKVFDFIRAQSQPYPGAYTHLNGQKLIVWRAALLPQVIFGIPGQVAFLRDEGVVVICGDERAVLLEKVGVDGKIFPAREIIRSIKVRLLSPAAVIPHHQA